MALGSTQPLIEVSTRNLPGGKGRPSHKADNLTVICVPIVQIGRSSSSGRVKNFHFSMLSRPALGFTQPPIQWVPETLSRG
jgi:hypothetical protein